MAVIDLQTRRVEGYVPAGWFAALVALSPDGQRLFVSSAKGLGSGRNAGPGFDDPGRGLHPGDIMQGTLQILDAPRGTLLTDGTRQVEENTYVRREVPLAASRALPYVNSRVDGPIKHIVFVVKENRTYDQVFGQRRGARGNPAGASLGLGVRVASKDGTRVLDVGGHHAESSRARRSFRHQRQLLLRCRSVQHRASLGGRRLSQRVGGSERAVAHRGTPVRHRRRDDATSTARAR